MANISMLPQSISPTEALNMSGLNGTSRIPFNLLRTQSNYGPGGLADTVGLDTSPLNTIPSGIPMSSIPTAAEIPGGLAPLTGADLLASYGGSNVSGLMARGMPGGTLGTLSAIPAGIALGNAVSGTSAGQTVINNARGANDNPIASAVNFLSPIMNASKLINTARNDLNPGSVGATTDTVGSLTGSGSGNGSSPDLSSDAIHSKLQSLGLSGSTYTQFVKDYNADIADATNAGMDPSLAARQVHDKYFGAVSPDGTSFTPGLASQYRQLDAANQQQLDSAHQAAALQSLVSTLAPQFTAPMAQTQAVYNAQMSNLLPSLPSYLQPLAQLQQANFNADQSNRINDSLNFYNQIPQTYQAAQEKSLQDAYNARLQSQQLAALLPTPQSSSSNAVTPAALIAQQQAAAGTPTSTTVK